MCKEVQVPGRKIRRATCTVDADGKVLIHRGDEASTKPALEESVDWPSQSLERH